MAIESNTFQFLVSVLTARTARLTYSIVLQLHACELNQKLIYKSRAVN